MALRANASSERRRVRLSELPSAVPLEIVRDGDFLSLGLLSLRSPGMLACLHDAKALHECESNPDLACVITSPELAGSVPSHLGVALSDAPRATFVDVQRHLGMKTGFYGADAATEVSPDAVIDERAVVATKNVRIGKGCIVEAGAVILERSVLEDESVVRAGAVIGAEGFHPVPYRDAMTNLPHFGGVVIGRRADIGANGVVCRSVFHNNTTVGEDCVLGPLVYVAHGVTIGSRCRIAASARICGSSTIGDDVFVGPNAVISNQISVGSGARVSIGSVVVRNVPGSETVTGNFAVEHRHFMKTWKGLFR